MEESLARPVGMPRVGKGRDDAEDVGRARKDESENVVVSESLYDGREEVGDRGRCNVAEYQQKLCDISKHFRFPPTFAMKLPQDSTYQHPHLDILEREDEAVEQALVLAGSPIVLADILLKSPNGQSHFLLSQPGRCPRKVGQNEKRSQRDGNGDDTFDDEEPPPRAQSKLPVHVISDARGNQTRECTGDE